MRLDMREGVSWNGVTVGCNVNSKVHLPVANVPVAAFLAVAQAMTSMEREAGASTRALPLQA